MAALWARTQHPAEQGRCDLRLDAMTYLPRPTPEGQVRFRTIYHYDVRFGRIGQWIDRLLFRALCESLPVPVMLSDIRDEIYVNSSWVRRPGACLVTMRGGA